MFYIAQLTSILVAVYLARNNATAVNHFSDHGFPENLAQFHSSNLRLKLCLCAGLSLMIVFNHDAYFFNYLIDALIAGLTNAAWIWLVFDPVLNKTRKRGFNWDYLGDDNGTDRFLKKRLGKNAGQIKAIICLVVIVGLNILYSFV